MVLLELEPCERSGFSETVLNMPKLWLRGLLEEVQKGAPLRRPGCRELLGALAWVSLCEMLTLANG